MLNKRVLISVYNNASGFLWSLMMYDGGTDLGWSGFIGNNKWSKTFVTYEDALENAINNVNKCSLDEFKKINIPWKCYADHIKK